MRTFARWSLLCLLVMAACTDDEAPPKPYAVVSDGAWALQAAADPPEDDPSASAERPPVDWYSEHVRTVPASGGTEGQMVRLSGHRASSEEARTAMEALGWEFASVTPGGWEGLAGTSPSDPGGPAVVLLDNGSTTLMLLSYELTVEEVTSFASSVEAVDEPTWERAVA